LAATIEFWFWVAVVRCYHFKKQLDIPAHIQW